MHLTRLRIERVRNLQTVVLNQLQPFNIFYGANASGKSSILEAIHLLATGKSFRTNLVKQYIQHECMDALIYAESINYRLGVQKQASGEQLIRLNGDTLATQSELARLLPVQLIDPESIALLDMGSKPRRQLLDWLMFHVEREFYPLWLRYQRALKQRNSLLRHHSRSSAATQQSIASWEAAMAGQGELIHALREQVMQQWQPLFLHYCQLLLPDQSIHMAYSAGFDIQAGLQHSLQQHRQKDAERGSTQHGPHRADLRLKTTYGVVDEVLSRGQKKLLVLALKLSQIHMLHDQGYETVVLLDDMTAELDEAAQQRLLSTLIGLGSQVFMTTLDYVAVQKTLDALSVTQFALFEIRHGQVQPVAA